jgi:hypothetical protein
VLSSLQIAEVIMKSKIVAAVVILLLLGFSKSSFGQREWGGFRMGDFQIDVTEVTSETRVFKEISELVRSRDANPRRINQLLSGKTFRGKGSCRIIRGRFPVVFTGVELEFHPESLSLVAISGQAKPSLGVGAKDTISYQSLGFPIKVRIRTVLLMPQKATAAATVCVPGRLFTRTMVESYCLASQQAEIGAGGEVSGKDFKSGTDLVFTPPGCTYLLTIDGDADHEVNLRDARGVPKGVILKGTASRGSIDFTMTATMTAEPGEAVYALSLSGTYDLEPECGYELTLKEGRIEYLYAFVPVKTQIQKPVFTGSQPHLVARPLVPEISSYSVSPALAGKNELLKALTLMDCEGRFTTDLAVPAVVPDMSGQRIRLNDLILLTDESGNLFGKTEVPKFKLSRTYRVECQGDQAYVFFDNWAEGGRHYDCDRSEMKKDPDRYCENHLLVSIEEGDPMGRLSRPGLTVYSGVFSFQAPQAPDTKELHTKFWGNLTVTPIGVTGRLTSGGYSFVPDESPDRVVNYMDRKQRLSDIIAHGNDRPEEPEGLFKLADLQIQEMRIESLRFCESMVFESDIRYHVHFPHPSHFALEFVDNSLDDDGVFHQANGPYTYMGAEITEEGISKQLVWDAVGKIFWFWRLPVVFYPGGVALTHKTTAGGTTKIDILNADLLIPRVVSVIPDSQDVTPRERQGLAFRGMLKPGGMFQLVGHAKDGWFGREKSSALDCYVGSLKLANLTDPPASRETDAGWSGKLRFPFFRDTDVSFDVRNITCKLTEPLMLAALGERVLDLTTSPVTLDPESTMQVILEEGLDYTFETGGFHSPRARYQQKTAGQVQDWEFGFLHIQSYISAYIIPKDSGENKPFTIKESQAIGDCDKLETVVQQIIDPVKNPPDLVCYDEFALARRNSVYGEQNTCVANVRGTYQVMTIDENGGKTITLSMPNATYYLYRNGDANAPNMLTLENSQSNFATDDAPEAQGSPQTLSIPGAQFYVDPASGIVEGILGFSTDIGVSLPVEASTKILYHFDPGCGYFYLYGNMSVLYFVEFGGQILVCHAPQTRLENMQIGSTNVLDELAHWTYTTPRTLKEACFDAVPVNAGTVTGLLVGGRASFELGFVGLGAGAGIWYFQLPSDSGNEIRPNLGLYISGIAYVDLIVVQGSLETFMSGSFLPQDAEIKLLGEIGGCICVSAFIGHAQAAVAMGIVFSNQSGVDLLSPEVDVEVGWGGCNCV